MSRLQRVTQEEQNKRGHSRTGQEENGEALLNEERREGQNTPPTMCRGIIIIVNL